jgi:hypothetical protein
VTNEPGTERGEVERMIEGKKKKTMREAKCSTFLKNRSEEGKRREQNRQYSVTDLQK